MNATEFLRQPAAQAVGWALLHFVWQGALIGAVTFVILVCLRRSAADVRYVVSAIALSLMATMPIVTGLQFARAERGRLAVTSGVTDVSSAGTTTASAASANAVTSAASGTDAGGIRAIGLERWLPVLVACWFAGVLVLTLRLASGWVWVQRMKTRGTVAAAPAVVAVVARLAKRLHIARRVRPVNSSLVDVPTVIGWLEPVILLPASVLAGLTPLQVELILAHELAHIRRHDYLVNLLQTLVETLLFYHPAVWWLSRRIRAERENCCDDLAVRLCGDPYIYAKALADLEDLRSAGGQLVMAATGGSLLHRVRRLLGAPSHAGRAPGWLAGAAAIVVMVGIAASAIGTHAIQAQQAPVAAATPAGDAAPAALAEPVVALSPRSGPEARAVVAASEAGQSEHRSTSQDTKTGKSSGNVIWSHNGEKIEINYSGEFEFSDDDTDVARMTPTSELRIKESGWISSHSVEFRSNASGTITRRYWSGVSEKPFDPEGRQWLAQMLPRFIRQSGLGAPARVARILKKAGPQGVLHEISLIEGSYGKRLYFTELLKAPLEAATMKQVLVQAGKEIDSDYELATLLIDSADTLLVDDAARRAYFDASKSISSDYEMRRVFSAALQRGPIPSALLTSLLDASVQVDSDYEEASLLVQVAGLQPLDAVSAPAFFKALDGVSSWYERGRVLKEVVRRPDVTDATAMHVIRAAGGMSSDYEKSQALQALASSRQLTGAVRDAYIDVATALGDYEKDQSLAALVKSERRTK